MGVALLVVSCAPTRSPEGVLRALHRTQLPEPRPAAVQPADSPSPTAHSEPIELPPPPLETFLDPIVPDGGERRITSYFGMRRDPIHGRMRMHRGVDYGAPTGSPVYATASGRALMAGYCDRGTGNCVVIEHANGWRSQYFHLNAVHIPVNAEVSRGDHIGDVGSTGRATGPHLHFQIGQSGQAIDPLDLIGEPLSPPQPALADTSEAL